MPDKTQTQRGAADPARGTVEHSDFDPRGARLMLLGIGALLLLVVAAAAGLLSLFGSMREPPRARPQATAVPLQTDEAGDRAAIERRAAERLAGKDGGVPIDEAIRRTAELGWDAP